MVYLDLDGTLLGPSGSILVDPARRFTTAGVRALVRRLSDGALRLADNGHTGPGDAHILHLLPAAASKATAVACDIAARGADPADCLAVGDSAQDLDIGRVLGTVAIVANGAAACADTPPTRAGGCGRPSPWRSGASGTPTRSGCARSSWAGPSALPGPLGER